MTRNTWFDVDKEGLAKLLKRRGMQYVLFELLANCWDTGATSADVVLEPVEGRPLVHVNVTDDDPNGFRDLRHAWTLFAESERKGSPEKRGRFNLGEKLVLAACEEAAVISTTGTVIFDRTGARRRTARRREAGTTFEATIRMTRAELDEVLAAAKTVIAPIPTTLNGWPLSSRTPLHTFTALLLTEVADDEGYLRRGFRETEVRVYARLDGRPSRIYEMGIPVVELDEPYDVEVMQKVPLSAERDNVTPAYLRDVRVAVLNAMHEQLSVEDAAKPAVADALCDKDVSAKALKSVLDKQYGPRRAVYDPSDPEANNRLVAEGYTLIHGGAFSADAWANIRTHEAALPAGQLRPTPKPYSTDPNAPARKLLPPEEWTESMCTIAHYARAVADRLLGRTIAVVIDKGRVTDDWAACYGGGELVFNLAKLGRAFFDGGPSERVNSLLIHELAHETQGNHLDANFYKALQRLGAGLVELALAEPELFRAHGWASKRARLIEAG